MFHQLTVIACFYFLLASTVLGCIPTESPSDEEETSTSTSTTSSSTSTTSTTSTSTTTTTSTTSTTTTTTTTTTPLCPPNWIYFSVTGFCYFLGVDLMLDYNQAQAYCVSQGANLASIHSDAENDFIVGLAPEEDQHLIIGLRRTGPCPTCFANYDGTAVDYYHWATGQPDNIFNNENCVEMLLTRHMFPCGPCIPDAFRSQWNDHPCTCPNPANPPDCPPKYLICKMPQL